MSAFYGGENIILQTVPWGTFVRTKTNLIACIYNLFLCLFGFIDYNRFCVYYNRFCVYYFIHKIQPDDIIFLLDVVI